MIEKPGKPPSAKESYRRTSLLSAKNLEAYQAAHGCIQLSIWLQTPTTYCGANPLIRCKHRKSSRRKKVLYCNLHQRSTSLQQGMAWRSHLLNETPTSKNPCKLVESDFSGSIFRVLHEETKSGYHPIAAGVSQGSVIGSLLYLVPKIAPLLMTQPSQKSANYSRLLQITCSKQ